MEKGYNILGIILAIAIIGLLICLAVHRWEGAEFFFGVAGFAGVLLYAMKR